MHEGDDITVIGKDTKTLTSEGKKSSQLARAEHQSQLEVLMEKKVAGIQSEVDKKLASFSQYLDRHLAGIESKLEALAEAAYQHETDVSDILRDRYSDKTIDDKLEGGLDGIRSLIAVTVEHFSTKIVTISRKSINKSMRSWKSSPSLP